MKNRYNPAAEILSAILALDTGREIQVKFYGRDQLVKMYDYMVDLLKTDKDVEYIIDAETGEIIYDDN